MTPENPIASELATVRRKVDQIFAYVSTQRPVGENAFKRADLIALMELVENLVREGSIQQQQFESLITIETSGRFDELVRTVGVAHFGEDFSGEVNFDDIPF